MPDAIKCPLNITKLIGSYKTGKSAAFLLSKGAPKYDIAVTELMTEKQRKV